MSEQIDLGQILPLELATILEKTYFQGLFLVEMASTLLAILLENSRYDIWKVFFLSRPLFTCLNLPNFSVTKV